MSSEHVVYDDYMSGADALMWAMDNDPFMRSAGAGVLLLEREPDRERLRASVERLVAANPRFRQIVVESSVVPTAPPRFVDDEHFDIDFHLYELSAPGDGTMRDLLDLAERARARNFDKQRPLWEFVLVTGLADGAAALVIMLHHSITDAIGAMTSVLAPLLDMEADGREPPPVAPAARPTPSTELVRGALEHEASGLLGFGISLLRAATGAVSDPRRSISGAADAAVSLARTFAPAGAPMSPLMTERSLAVRMDDFVVDFRALRAAGKRADGSLNDALVAGIMGALDRYHAHHGVPLRGLRMMMPISLRDRDVPGRAGNELGSATLVIPAGIADVDERIRLVADASAEAHADSSLNLFGSVAGLASRLPAPLVAGMYRGLVSGVDFITSNVPGPRDHVYLAGERLESFFAFGPMGMAALNVSVMSYAGTVHLGVHTDLAAIPDTDVFLRCLDESFAELCPPVPVSPA